MIAAAGVRKPPLSKAKRTFATILRACPIAIQTGLGIAFLLCKKSCKKGLRKPCPKLNGTFSTTVLPFKNG
jgi:hypothetical protein